MMDIIKALEARVVALEERLERILQGRGGHYEPATGSASCMGSHNTPINNEFDHYRF